MDLLMLTEPKVQESAVAALESIANHDGPVAYSNKILLIS
jgi:hypothetical protein